MEFDYSVLNSITNPDFKASKYSAGLYEKCVEIERKYRESHFKDCIRDVRSTNEAILRYMYERLMSYYGREKTAGEMLREDEFCNKVDIHLVKFARDVQRIANNYHHDDKEVNEAEEGPIDAEEILRFFSKALKCEIAFINDNIPHIRGKLKIQLEENAIDRQTGETVNRLVAQLTDVPDIKAYTYAWKRQSDGGTYQRGRYWFLLDAENLKDQIIILEATNEKIGQTLTAEYGPIKPEEIKLRTNQRAPIAAKRTQTVVTDISSGSRKGTPSGRLYIEKVENFNGAGVKLTAKLENADFSLEDPDVSIEWGFVGRTGNYYRIFGGKPAFTCLLKEDPFNKKYKCIVRRQGFTRPLEATFRRLAEEDFAIKGTIVIRFDAEESALKATVKNSNFEGQPQYTWYRNDVIQKGKQGRSIKVSKKDVGATYTCEITHPALTFSKKAETPYTLTQEDFGGAPTSSEQKPKAQSSSTNRSLKKVLAICAGLFVLICGIMFTKTLLPNGQDNTHPNPGDSDTIPTDSGYLTSSIAELNAGLMDGTYKQVLFGDYAVYCLNNDGTVTVYTEDEDIRQDFAEKYSSWSEVTVIYEGYAGGLFGLRDDGAALTPDDKMKVVNLKSGNSWLEVVPTYDGFYGVTSDGTIALANFEDVSAFKIESLQGCTKIECVETKDTDVIGLTPSGTIATMGVGPLLYDAGQQYKEWDNLSDISVCDRSTDLFGLTNDGTILYAGAFSSGEEDFFDDADVESWTDITDISTGDSHLVALKKDGTVLAAGDNQYGQCNVGEWKDIVRVEANSDSTVGYSSTGEIYVAGYNYLADKPANSVD